MIRFENSTQTVSYVKQINFVCCSVLASQSKPLMALSSDSESKSKCTVICYVYWGCVYCCIWLSQHPIWTISTKVRLKRRVENVGERWDWFLSNKKTALLCSPVCSCEESEIGLEKIRVLCVFSFPISSR